jgi:hypothetical protein
MKISAFGGAALAAFVVIYPAFAADDLGLTRMTLCQDSWAEWNKKEPAKLKAFGDRFRTQFSRHDNDAFLLPKASVSVLGMHVTQAFPDSVGMGVGFSINVDAPFDAARAVMEKGLGKKFAKCETGDGMKSCEMEVAPQRSAVVMAEDSPKDHQTLIGCYYFYEK